MLLALLLAAAARQDPRLTLRVAGEAPEFGVPFELVVEREWPRGWQPSAWDARDLAPLDAQLASAARDEDDARVRETLRYRARVLTLGDLAPQDASFLARPPEADAARVVVGSGPRIAVRSSLPADDAGEPEWLAPSAVPRARSRGTHLLWAAGVAGAALLALFIGARRRSAPAVAPAARDDGFALAQLAQLVTDAPADRRAVVDRLAQLARERLAGRLGDRARSSTAAELTAHARAVLGDEPGERLGRIVAACEGARFGAGLPEADALRGWIAEARALLDGGGDPREGAA